MIGMFKMKLYAQINLDVLNLDVLLLVMMIKDTINTKLGNQNQ